MGLIVLPVFLIAFVIGFISFLSMQKHIRNNEIKFKEIFFGLILSITLYSLICLSYVYSYYVHGEKAWGLGPTFIIPIIMIYIPSFTYLLFSDETSPKLAYLSKIILTSVVVSTFVGLFFIEILFNLLDYLGIEKSF